MTAPPYDACSPTTATLGGRTLVSFGGCNYLGLAQHPRVTAAAADAIGRFGLSTTASRETTGNTRVHEDLERALCAFCGAASALLVPDGYIANLTAMQALAAGGVREAVIDERAHPSLLDAAVLAGMNVRAYRHLDAGDAARVLGSCAGPAVVATDSVFAATGAIAPGADLLGGLRSDDVLLLDDCHGLGVLGREGRGLADHLGLGRDRLVVTATLAKGLGCGGGVVMGPRGLTDLARRVATAYVCTTPCSPVLAAAAIEALRVLRDEPGLHEALAARTRRVRAMLADAFGVDRDRPTPIVAFAAGSVERMVALHGQALDAGVLAPLVDYPGGPAPRYFRLSVSAAHTDEQIDRLGVALGVREPAGEIA